ncbi:DUF6491 family protein [Gammaproteobacteria bacterium]|nr:DUF6491 family protein [Gammaproteobacteria bacterium]
MKISGVLITLVFSIVFSGIAIAELQGSEERNVGMESRAPESAQDLDPKDWGIRNGCISRSRIRHMHFVDDETAIIDIMGRKKVLLTMRRECRGIKREGFITRVRGNSLCARFDRFEVLDTGISCAIKSLEPYIEPEEVEDIEEPKDSKDKNKNVV